MFQIDEPKTPYHGYSDTDEDASNSSNRPRRVSLVNCPVDPEELSKGLANVNTNAASSTGSLKLLEPGCGPEEEEDESELTEEQLGLYIYKTLLQPSKPLFGS